ncbi:MULTISPECIES: hypothetical protein [Micromonospora]|nr:MULTISPECIES: hypothetical protein [Micromonospora]
MTTAARWRVPALRTTAVVAGAMLGVQQPAQAARAETPAPEKAAVPG